MSEQADQLRVCPHCGQENALFSLKCIRCGQVLEDLFLFDDLDADEQDPAAESFSEVLAALNESSLLDDEKEAASLSGGELENLENGLDDSGGLTDRPEVPDWLEWVRERSREEDASGEMAKGGQAMDERRSAEGSSQVDRAFDEIIQRIREQSEKERKKARRVNTDLVDENGDPEWLRRIRELHPQGDQDTKQVLTGSQDSSFEDEWTEEELQELLRREIGDEFNQPASPNVEEEHFPAEDDEQSKKRSDLETDHEVPFDFHNIPDDDLDEFPLNNPNRLNNPGPPEDADSAPVENQEYLEGALIGEPDEEEPAFEIERPASEPAAPEQVKEEENEEESSQTESKQPGDELTEQEDQKSSETDETKEAVAQQADEEKHADEPAEDGLKNPAIDETIPDLLLLRNQRDRAQVLTNIIGQEGRRSIPVLHENTRQGKLGRLILALLLLAGVIFSLVIGPGQDLDLPVSLPAIAMQEKSEQMQPGEVVLVVLDYQAATSSEIEPLVIPVLEDLRQRGVSLRYVTSQPVDLWLGEGLFDSERSEPTIEIEFIPGGILGYLALASGSSPNWGATPIEQAVKDGTTLMDETNQVLLVSDSPEFVRNWLEQVNPWHPDVPTFAVSIALNEALLLPYFESGQLSGFVAGHPGGVGQSEHASQRAWQAGTLIMIVVLILGMITKIETDAAEKGEGIRHA